MASIGAEYYTGYRYKDYYESGGSGYTVITSGSGGGGSADLSNYYDKDEIDASFYTNTHINNNFDDYNGFEIWTTVYRDTILSGEKLNFAAGTDMGLNYDPVSNTLTYNYAGTPVTYEWELFVDGGGPYDITNGLRIDFIAGDEVSIDYNFNSGIYTHEVTINSDTDLSNYKTISQLDASYYTQYFINNNFDDYSNWNIVDGIYDRAISSGDQVEFVSGTDIQVQYGTSGSVHQITIDYVGTPPSAYSWNVYADGTGPTNISNGLNVDFIAGTNMSITEFFNSGSQTSEITFNSTDQYQGTVTSVATGTGITGGTITSSGTVSASSSAIPATATDLGSGADLNNYQTPGFYYQNSNADAGTGSNYPVSLAGALTVKTSAGVVQEYHTYGSTNDVYVRTYYSSSWTSWRLVTWTCSNQTNNRVVTSAGSSGELYNAESNLTFDGTDLNITGSLTLDGIELDDSTDRSGLLEINRLGSTSWSGLQVKYSSTALWSLMATQTQYGLYDDYNAKWILIYNENGNTTLYHNGSSKFATTSGGISVTGAVIATGEVESYDTSDIRLKEDIKELDKIQTTEALMKLKPIRYHHKKKEKTEIGLIAQEVIEDFPEIVKEDDEGMLMIQYAKMVPALLATIQRQEERIKKLEEVNGLSK